MAWHSPSGLQDINIPFPRTSGARFSAAGLCFFIVCDFVEREYVLLTCCLTDVEYCILQITVAYVHSNFVTCNITQLLNNKFYNSSIVELNLFLLQSMQLWFEKICQFIVIKLWIIYIFSCRIFSCIWSISWSKEGPFRNGNYTQVRIL